MEMAVLPDCLALVGRHLVFAYYSRKSVLKKR